MAIIGRRQPVGATITRAPKVVASGVITNTSIKVMVGAVETAAIAYRYNGSIEVAATIERAP